MCSSWLLQENDVSVCSGDLRWQTSEPFPATLPWLDGFQHCAKPLEEDVCLLKKFILSTEEVIF